MSVFAQGDKVADNSCPHVQGIILTPGEQQSVVRWVNHSHHDLPQEQVCCNSWLILYGEAEEIAMEIELAQRREPGLMEWYR